MILQANFSYPAEAVQLQDARSSSVSGTATPAEAQVREELFMLAHVWPYDEIG